MKRILKKILLILFCLLFSSTLSLAQDTTLQSFEGYKIVIAGKYQASGFKRFFAGDHWRNLWITPIKVPVLNLNKFAGGLTPTKKGGGLQTKSLHFIGNDGKEYKFRSVDKDVRRSLPPDFQESIIADAMQDQVSVTNPASCLVVAPLMDEVGILNSKPILCLMPDDELLGEFRSEFAGLLGTVEEDPEDYDNNSLNFAHADKIINTFKLYEKLQKDTNEQVDAAEFLKARFFDILIGDRDRHAGQWNWAGYKKGKKRIWKSIPKDRDFAFPLYDGLVPRIMTIAITSMVHFDYDMPSMLDMTWEGRHLDRRLLSSLDKPVWDSVALFMQNALNDQVIESAVLQMPNEYFQQEGNLLISKLKSRRDQLKIASDEFYNWVSKYVDVYCTDQDEYAEINRVNDFVTEITVYKRDKVSGEKTGSHIYHRVLKNDITDEVRLHLLGEDDVAVVFGKVKEGIRVIVEGGEGKDKLIDSSSVDGYILGFTPISCTKTKTEFYDSGKKTTFIELEGTYLNRDRFHEPEDPQQKYEPPVEDRFRDYGVLVPFEYNTDDGFVLGIGGRINYYDFRKIPYAHRFDLSGSYATLSKRAEFDFLGDFYDMFEGLNTKTPVKFTGLKITRFYGFGNESVRDDSLLNENYYNVNQKYFGAGFYLMIPILNEMEIHTGLLFEISDVFRNDNQLINTLQPFGLGTIDFFALSASLKFDNRDDKEIPFTGYYLDVFTDVYPPTLNNKKYFGKVTMDGRTYFSTNYLTDFTLALRAYSEIAWGSYPFYKGASIGGKKTLRGFPRDRFVGDYALLGSIELRYYLTKVYFLVPFKLGMNLFTDTGRVFYEDEESSKWHTSFGGGLWFSINEKAINFSLNLAKSPETLRFYISIGQMF
ncbi:MAG: BamA/TamA family outer membrane protein [Ignavibacteriaceae bacterium]|nr:BamA/TamA family outer membrane protein [Ignavibacteriaceae bacterium]